jgi:hypothetical protein
VTTGHQPRNDQPTACRKCRRPFDPTGPWHRAQEPGTPWCRECVNRCHDSEIADHCCDICR